MAENANCGLRIAECRIRNAQFEIRTLAASLPVRLLTLIFCFVLIAVAPAQTSDQQPSIGPKLPLVRCTIAPTKDAVRWKLTPTAPVTPVAEKEESIDPVALAQIPNQQQPVEAKLTSVHCTIAPRWQSTPTAQSTPVAQSTPIAPGTPVSEKDKSTQRVESQTPDISSQLAILSADPPNDRRNQNGNCGMSNPQSAIRDPQFTTDGWFQISTETQEPTDIQEVVLTTSADDGKKAGPEPLAQVLANLARAAERNFVDPGIPADETITYNFADSDLDPWEAFTRIAEARGYRLVYWGDVVTLTRSQQDPLNPVNPHTVKAEVWIWVDQSAKPKVDRELVLQLAGAEVAPNGKPQTVRSLEAGSKATISFIDAQSERGDSTLRLTVNPVLLPNGNIEAGLGIENAVPSLNGHKAVTIRRNINHTLELTPSKQVVEIDGILMPSNDPDAGKQSWIQRLFRSKKPTEKSMARMVVKLTVEPAAGSQTPIPTDNPVRIPRSDSGKTGIVLAPGQVRGTPELTSIQTLKH
jgi:hypothetical protein